MNIRTTIFSLYLLSSVIIAVPAYSKDDFKLKPGARGELCLRCHETVKKTVKSSFVHPLVKKGDCTGCHVPHTSSHKNLLTTGTRKLCFNCHKEVLPENARSAHKIVVEGDCAKCHDVHGANKKFVLSDEGNALCFACHSDMGDGVRFKHPSVAKGKGCLNCHDPHASTKSHFLLAKDVPLLCMKCHQTDKRTFKRTHMDYPVEDSNCTSCHNPHGSNNRGIVFDVAHTAVTERRCTECHQGPTTKNSLKTKKQTAQLCRECHRDITDQAFSKNRVHWPLVAKVGCLNCHSPHATKEKKLLQGSIVNVCGKCHGDTIQLQELSKNNPRNEKLCEPVKTGSCTTCHSPHGSDNVLLLEQPFTSVDLCAKCHEWQTHSTHPIGEKAIDPRDKNLTMGCLSCHKACGTANNPAMLTFATTYELCIQCHADLRR